MINLPHTKSQKKGFTILEMLIAVAIFGIVSMLGVTVFVDITRAQRKISLENNLIEDSRFIMEQIVKDVMNNSIDYEEYFNQKAGEDYGKRFGAYAETFYDFGSDEMGTNCTPKETGPLLPSPCFVNANTIDRNLGSSQEGAESALNAQTQGELYLISPDAKRKTFYRLLPKNIQPDTEKWLAIYKMEGSDLDGNGVYDSYTNAENFKPGPADPTKKIIDNPEDYFEKISPSRVNIRDVKFIITPLEDPRKAFAEPDQQIQPRITIVLTVEPSKVALGGTTPPVIPQIILQTSISSRIFSEVKSFPARADQKATK